MYAIYFFDPGENIMTVFYYSSNLLIQPLLKFSRTKIIKNYITFYFLTHSFFYLLKKSEKVLTTENLCTKHKKKRVIIYIHSPLISLTNELAVKSMLDFMKNIEAFLLKEGIQIMICK